MLSVLTGACLFFSCRGRHTAEIAALQHALQVSRDDLATRQMKSAESKKSAKRQLEDVRRSFQAKVNSVESELHAANERIRTIEKAKQTAAKELEANLAQTISLYAVIQQHQSTIEQQRVKCEQSDAQYGQTASKLMAAEKEMTRLRLLLEREHDSNERHIQAQKGQLSMKTDECLALGSKLATLEQEYAAHREQYESKIDKLEKDRSILEAVNFELRAEKEKNYNLARENEEMKSEILKKAHLQGQHDAALEQIATMSTTISRLEDERAAWTGERRDLDHALGEVRATLKLTTAERDAGQIEAASLQRQMDAQTNENMRQREAAHEGALKREHDLQAQIDERDHAHVRTLQTIETLQGEISGLRTEQKRLLDVQASLESQVRDAAKLDEEKSSQLEKTAAEKEALASQVEQLVPQLAKSQAHAHRTVESRDQLVAKLDAHYLHSSTAQIFQRWKSEYRVQADHRRSAAAEERVKALQQELAELPHHHHRELEKARTEWHETAASRAHHEREEQRAREHRIAEERERIREDVAAAHRLEVEAVRARDHSMARRPSVQSLVGHVVAAALDHLPAGGEGDHHGARRRSSSRGGDHRSSSSDPRAHRSHHHHDGTRKHRHHHHHHYREEPTTTAGTTAAHSRSASPNTSNAHGSSQQVHALPFQVVLEAHHPVSTGATASTSKSLTTQSVSVSRQSQSAAVSYSASPMPVSVSPPHSARSRASPAPRSARSSVSTTAAAAAPKGKTSTTTTTGKSTTATGEKKTTTKAVVPPLPLQQIQQAEAASSKPHTKSLKQTSTETVSHPHMTSMRHTRAQRSKQGDLGLLAHCFALLLLRPGTDVGCRLSTRLLFPLCCSFHDDVDAGPHSSSRALG